MPTRRRAIILGGLAVLVSLPSFHRFDKNNTNQSIDTNTDARRIISGDTITGETTPSEEPGGSEDADTVDIRDYGAKGDGVTDDSEAIQSAIESAEPGETVLVPETNDSYLISFDGKEDGEAGINLQGKMGLDDVVVKGETASAGAQTLQVEPGSYNSNTFNAIINIAAVPPISGLRFQNLTLDGARPRNDGPAAQGGEDALVGFHVSRGRPYSGNSIEFVNCLVQNCSDNAFRFEEPGISCRYVTARRCGRHGFGFTPSVGDTDNEPGFHAQSIKAVDNDGTGIDHRRGTAKLIDVYTENNRSGNKWKHSVKRMEVVNHHSVNDRNEGWRSNHSADNNDGTPPEQEILFDQIFIENPDKGGFRVSGTDTTVRLDLQNIEVRGARNPSKRAGAASAVHIFRDIEIAAPINRLVAVETTNGVGLYVYKTSIEIDTYEHYDNDEGGFSTLNGEVSIDRNRNVDPGRNVFDTPGPNDVGAFTGSDIEETSE